MAADRSQWLRGVTDLLVLAALRRGPSYGYALVEQLGAAGFDDLNEATVYGTLRRLEAAGLLSSSLARSTAGPARRNYELTTAGRTALRDGSRDWRGFAALVEGVFDSATRGRSAS
jgi:PadR family transcriptional regulator PadR